MASLPKRVVTLPFRIIRYYCRYGVRGDQPSLVFRTIKVYLLVLAYEVKHKIAKHSTPLQLKANAEKYHAMGYLNFSLSKEGADLLNNIAVRFQKLVLYPENIGSLKRVIIPGQGSNPGEPGKYFVLLDNSISRIPEIRLFIRLHLHDQITALLGADWKIGAVSCNRRKPLDKEKRKDETYNNYWHCDHAGVNQGPQRTSLKVIMNLNEHDGNCAYRTFSLEDSAKTHKYLPENMKMRYESDMALPEQLKKTVPEISVGPLGTGMYTNVSECFHRGGEPLPGTWRDSLHIEVGK